MSRHVLPLADDEVHIWSASLDRPAGEVAALTQLLSADERDRLARIRCMRTHSEFAIARGVLRTLLGAYLNVDAAELRFSLGPVGKPELSHPLMSGLHFNLTHSRGLALFAVTKRCAVGVDVEHLRPMSDYLGLAQRYFSPREVEILIGLRGEQRMEAFFHAWTRKEAFLKARGVGLSYGLERVEVTLGRGEPARIMYLDGEEAAARSWSLRHLEPEPGYIGALALDSHDYRLICRKWPTGSPF